MMTGEASTARLTEILSDGQGIRLGDIFGFADYVRQWLHQKRGEAGRAPDA